MTDEARFEALRVRLGELIGRSHSLARQLGGLNLGELRGPADLALIPVLRKSALAALQSAEPPFGALAAAPTSAFPRLFASMLRGAFNATPGMEVNYATYFSTNITETPFDSYRVVGGRAGIFLTGPRLEVGGSFQHLLQDDHSNAFGFHFAWQPRPLPLDIRAEYARSHNGSGYWIESAYRLSQVPVWHDVMKRVQFVARMQQFYAGRVPDDDLPTVNTNMFEFGMNYYFRDDCRFVSSYGRQFAPDGGNENVWTVGVTYRFVLPIGHGDIQ